MAMSGPYDELIPVLAGLPRPRPVRMSFKGQFTWFMIVVGPLGLLVLIAHDQAGPFWGWDPFIQDFAAILCGLEVLLGGLLGLRPSLKHRRLAAEGDLVVGEITEVRDSPRNPWVRYTFDTERGEKFTKGRQTFRVDLQAGMKVPVFYDPQEAGAEQVALCSSFYEVRLPNEVSRRGLEWLEWSLTICAVVIPLVLFVRHLGRPDLVFPSVIVGGMLAIIFKLAGKMRDRWWFWATMVAVVGAHVFLLLRMNWNVWIPGRALASLAIGDLVAIFALLKLVARLVGGPAAVKEEFPDGKLSP